MSEQQPEAPAVPGEPLILPPDELAALKSALEHAQAALAGDNEGVRLWMLDCGELVQKHRDRAEAAEARLAELRGVLLEGGQDAGTVRRRALAITGGEEEGQAESTLERLLTIIREVDAHIDACTADQYREQPLALHWARITKVCEEAGEVWAALSKCTGENPRKGICGTWDDLLGELGDTLCAAACAIQHVTKDEARTAAVILAAFEKAHSRIAAVEAGHARLP